VTKGFGSGALQGLNNIGGAIYGTGKTVVGTIGVGTCEVIGAVPAVYQGVNNACGGTSTIYTDCRAGANNAWGDVGAAAQDIYKPWNPYQANNPVSANSARVAENAQFMQATGVSGWAITTMQAADSTAYVSTNLAAGVGLSNALVSGRLAVSVSKSTGSIPVHFTYGYGTGGTYTAAHGLGSGLFTTTEGATLGGYWTTLTGIPVASPGAIAAWVGTKPEIGDCFVSTIYAFAKGWGL
jgi:hypothetical protein